MFKLYNEDTNEYIGTITMSQMQFLVDELEEESIDDKDYYLNELTIGMLEADHADADLVALLRQALDEHGEVNIVWKRE